MELHHKIGLWVNWQFMNPLKYPQPKISASYFETQLDSVTLISTLLLPQNPLLHLQWNISASLTWHAAPFLQGFGWQGLLPHSPTPLPYKLSPPFSCRLSTRLLTSSMRIQPTRPVATAVCSLALEKKHREKNRTISVWVQNSYRKCTERWYLFLKVLWRT